MTSDQARIWLAGIRIFNGAAGLVAPRWLASRVTPGLEASPATPSTVHGMSNTLPVVLRPSSAR